MANYTGSIEDVFGCIASLGEIRLRASSSRSRRSHRALGADGVGIPPAENAGFLRDDARLAIIMLTNEDDCTPRLGRLALFDTASNGHARVAAGAADQLPLQRVRARCAVAWCRDAWRPTATSGDMFTYDTCEPAEDAGMLRNVAETVAQIKALKNDAASQIVMASIQGGTGPYTVQWRGAVAARHDAVAGDGAQLHGASILSFADPGIRTANLTFSFGAKGFVFSICDYNFEQPLTRLCPRRSAVCSRRRASPIRSPMT